MAAFKKKYPDYVFAKKKGKAMSDEEAAKWWEGKDTPPKKPSSGFTRFSGDNRAKVKEENPELTFGQMGKKLGAMWGELDAAKKKEYADAYEAEKAEYQTVRINLKSIFNPFRN